jgi:formate dehydrogenase major subunit
VQSINDKDFGTPKRTSDQLITLEIDGRSVTVPAGTSVMRAAALADILIPKLCATDALEPFGLAACAWSKSKGATAFRPHVPRRWKPA